MNRENLKTSAVKEKAIHEFKELATITLYLGLFFCAVTLYSNLLLRTQPGASYLDYGFALINALVIAKFIMIGEYAKVGKKHEAKPLYFSIIYKAFVYGLLVFALHFVEEAIKALVHGEAVMEIFQVTRLNIRLAHALVLFCAFIPLFAFRELRRVLGEDRFQKLLFQSQETGRDAAA